MAYRSSTNGVGTSTTPATTVPAGVATNDIVILACGFDGSSNTFTGKWPSGFTQLVDAAIASTDTQRAGLAWKRLTGADSGSYTLSALAGSSDWVLQAFAFSGRDTVNPPVHSLNISTASNGSPVSVVATTLTALDGDDAIWISVPDVDLSGAGTGHTQPTNYLIKQDGEQGFSNLAGAIRDALSAGATGSITGTFTCPGQTAGYAGMLVRIPAPVSLAAAATLKYCRPFPFKPSCARARTRMFMGPLVLPVLSQLAGCCDYLLNVLT